MASFPTACQSVAGRACGAALWRLQRFDLARLRRDLAVAIAGWDWAKGRHGHSLPLTSRRLTDFGRKHANALIVGRIGFIVQPEERLGLCPYFSEIFDCFRCHKSGFRLLRRPAVSSYPLHCDDDIGMDTFRFQIPIESPPSVRLVVSNTPRRSDFDISNPHYAGLMNWSGLGASAMHGHYKDLVDRNPDRVRVYELESGCLYWFNTRNQHNVYNFGASARVTLAIDLVANDWLSDLCSTNGACVLPYDWRRT